jgi:DNA polymerase-1
VEKKKLDYKMWIEPAKPDPDWKSKYNFSYIDDIDKLKEILSQKSNAMGFDTETDGLNHEKVTLTGYSFCLDGVNCYYVPVNHRCGGLGEEAVKLIYDKLLSTPIVFMFNMRYDTRVMEWRGFKQFVDKIKASDLDEPQKQELYKRLLDKQFVGYDMSKVNTIDVQVEVFLMDSNWKHPALKKCEAYFLGWDAEHFEEALDGNINFYETDYHASYFYAATDALGTYLLGVKLLPFVKMAKKSGILDTQSLMPLTRLEQELTCIDTNILNKYSIDLQEKIDECKRRCFETAGEEFNLGSPVDNNRVLTKLNIHTGVTTTRGMSTSKQSIEGCLENLKNDDPARQFLQDLVDYAHYTKQLSSYVNNTLDMCKNNELHPNRLRFSYKNTEVPSGRYAAGGDKKNEFFSTLNIQNIPKPHVQNNYVLSAELVEKNFPDIYEKILESGSREEALTPLSYTAEQMSKLEKLMGTNDTNQIKDKISKGINRRSYKILDWVFSDYPWLIEDDEGIVEAFDPKLNIRSAFMPDDGYYWVSCLSLDTLVEIETGEKVPITFFKDAENRKNHKIKTLTKYTTVSAYMDRGIKKKCTLATESGLYLDCTEDHKILVIDNNGNETWKELKDITTDDYIISNIGGDSND